MAKPVEERQHLEKWRLKETRFGFSESIKTGWLCLIRKMRPWDFLQRVERANRGTPEQLLPFRTTRPWMREGSKTAQIKVSVSGGGGGLPSPGH
jgi:hypothetical protein